MSLARVLVFVLPLVAALPAAAAPVRVPVADGQSSTHLQLRVVSYDGHTNGGMTVEISNPGQSTETFSAQGLFFVPDANPNEAPQRLGALGPMRIEGDDVRHDKIAIPPGGKIVAHLDVYCIDSHRSSPTPQTQFHLAEKRMPRELSSGIANDANAAAQPYGGVSSPAPAAKSAVQGQVWKNRDKKWIQLEGEGRQEAGKR
jgi:hypothetical protein